jgi:hypothetical protein
MKYSNHNKLFIGLFVLLVGSSAWASSSWQCMPDPNNPMNGPGSQNCPTCSEIWKEYEDGTSGCSYLKVTVENNSDYIWVYDKDKSTLAGEFDGDTDSYGGSNYACILTDEDKYDELEPGQSVNIQFYADRDDHKIEATLVYKAHDEQGNDVSGFETTYSAVQDKNGHHDDLHSHDTDVDGEVVSGLQFAQDIGDKSAKCACPYGCGNDRNGHLGYQLLDPPKQAVVVTMGYTNKITAQAAAQEGYGLIDQKYITGLDQVNQKPIDIAPLDSQVTSTFHRICDENRVSSSGTDCYYQSVNTYD